MTQANISNRTIFCHDNLDVMRGMDSATIDLIYLDPPFNKKKTFTAPIGSSAEGASFSDIFREEDVKEEWLQDIAEDHFGLYELLNAVRSIEGRTSYNFCYLAYMAIRLIECHRILKETGSLYLHCDPTMSHYLKLLLDCIFGEKNFRREIIWQLPAASGYKSLVNNFVRGNDNILYYAKTSRCVFNKEYLPYDDKQLKRFSAEDAEGRKYKSITQDRRIYLDEAKGVPVTAVWTDVASFQTIVNSKERTGYPTQKPLALLERIIKASSNEGDLVLDPFCGCATTCVAAEKLSRQWVGVDVSVKAYDLVRERLTKEVANPESLLDFQKEIAYSTDPPKRTDKGTDTRSAKYVYIISHAHYEGEYKVGIATDAKARLNSYQTGDPNRAYKLEYSFHTPHFRAIEKYIHEKYDNKHEWVRGDVKSIKQDIENWKP